MLSYVAHVCLGFTLTLIWGLCPAVRMCLVVELTQAEYGGNYPWKKVFWRRLLSMDALLDVAADLVGIALALSLRRPL